MLDEPVDEVDALEAAFYARPERPRARERLDLAAILVDAWRLALGDLSPLLDRHGIDAPTAERIQAAQVGVLRGGKRGQRHRPHTIESLVGALRIRSEGAEWWPAEPGDDRAAPAIVQPVMARGGIVDLVAWHPAKPEAWRLLTGLGVSLGLWPHDERWNPFENEATDVLVLSPTPMAWLAKPATVCLLAYDDEPLNRTLDYRVVRCGGVAALAEIVREHHRRYMPEVKVS